MTFLGQQISSKHTFSAQASSPASFIQSQSVHIKRDEKKSIAQTMPRFAILVFVIHLKFYRYGAQVESVTQSETSSQFVVCFET